MNLDLIPYPKYERGLPQEGNFILGQEHNDNIIVYQAFNDAIADYAVANQKFGGPAYSFSRMTWIKPNFLWMMYRSGWAQKENQNRILAIEISKPGFEQLLLEGVLSSYDSSGGVSHEDWKHRLETSDVRIQWDPDHSPNGEKLKRRAVQIGIKDAALEKFNNTYIQSITDVTGFVNEQYLQLQKNKERLVVINEGIIEVSDEIKRKFSIPQTFISPYIGSLIDSFNKTGTFPDSEFKNFLADETENKRDELIEYMRNYKHPELSRWMLKRMMEMRQNESIASMSEDLLLFAYFVSKNKTVTDFDLIMDAKHLDFDTWCGFDGTMVFSTLGFEGTNAQLFGNISKYTQETVDKFAEYTKEYNRTQAFWYFY